VRGATSQTASVNARPKGKKRIRNSRDTPKERLLKTSRSWPKEGQNEIKGKEWGDKNFLRRSPQEKKKAKGLLRKVRKGSDPLPRTFSKKRNRVWGPTGGTGRMGGLPPDTLLENPGTGGAKQLGCEVDPHEGVNGWKKKQKKQDS